MLPAETGCRTYNQWQQPVTHSVMVMSWSLPWQSLGLYLPELMCVGADLKVLTGITQERGVLGHSNQHAGIYAD